ncbi:MAG: hypothetical protein V4603_11630 [Pseudomonadota bacterium]
MKQTSTNGPNTCDGFLDKLDMWLASELDANDSFVMQQHHDGCVACQQETRLARAIDTVTLSLPQKVCPPLRSPVAKETSASFVTRLLAMWREPLVLVPALTLVLAALLVVQFNVGDAPAAQPQTLVVNGQEYTQEEVIKAAADLELALRYLSKYGTYPARVVSTQLDESHLPLPPRQADGTAPAI